MKIRLLLIAFLVFISSVLSLTPTITLANGVAFVKLSDIKGDVFVKKGGGLREFPATDDMTLTQGDSLRTGAIGSVNLNFGKGTQTAIGANSELTIENLTNANSVNSSKIKNSSANSFWEKISIKLWAGSVWNRVATLLNINDQYDVETPTAIMGVRGTLYLVSIDNSTGATSGNVLEGFVAISQNKEQSEGGQQRMVSMGQQLQIQASEPSEQKAIDQKALIEKTDNQLLVQVINDIITRAKDLMQSSNSQQGKDLASINSALNLSTQSSELAIFAKEFWNVIESSTKIDGVKELLSQNNITIEEIQTDLDTLKIETKQTQEQVISTAKESGLSLEQINEIVQAAVTPPSTTQTPTTLPTPPTPPITSGDNGGDVGNDTAVEAVTALITALPSTATLTLDDAITVSNANNAFNALTTAQKALVSTANQTTLSNAVTKIALMQADQTAAEAVTALITALPSTATLTLDNEIAVINANNAFNALTTAQKALVSTANQMTLSNTVTKIALMQADQTAAEAVTALITALPSITTLTLDNAIAVSNANIAFNALTTAQKALVSTANQTTLSNAVTKIAQLQAQTSATISGKIALPGGVTVPDGGIKGHVIIKPQIIDTIYSTSFLIPAGVSSAIYSIKVPVDASSTEYIVSYRLDTNYSGYVEYGYYSTGGKTTTEYNSATLVNVSEGDVTGVDLTLLNSAILIEGFDIRDNIGTILDIPKSTTMDQTIATADFGTINDNQQLGAIQITSNPSDSTLQLITLVSPKIKISFVNKKTFLLSSPITMTELDGDTINDGDISLGLLRSMFGYYVTFNCTLSKAGYISSNVSLTLNLGTSTGTL